MKLIPRSYDILGSKQKAVALITLNEELKAYESDIASTIMTQHKNVKSVLVKESERVGDYRIRKFRLIAGDPNTEVLHKEHGCHFRLDPQKVYFSLREGEERERIVNKVKDGEEILVMFSGVGPFPIRIAKINEKIRITAIELNPAAYQYSVENIHINKVTSNVKLILGDVGKICSQLEKKFDRIIMPLPKGAYKYLNSALPLLKNAGVLHFYHWAPEPNIFKTAEELVLKSAKKHNLKTDILERQKVSQYSPRVWKVRIDVRISTRDYT